jgi:hypothetical protein
MLGISRTPPFRDFQRVAGLSTFDVNTIVVGLELIANGGQKPAGLNIKWTPPKNQRQAIEQTKHLVLIALMTYVVDAFDSLLRDYGALAWFELPAELLEILQKSNKKPDKSDWSISERSEKFFDFFGELRPIDLGLLELLVNWRNAFVHRRTSKFRLPRASEQIRQARTELATKYAQIDICKTLDSFENGKWPTLKEATTLLAIAQNIARSIDQALIGKFAGSTPAVEKIARKELAIALREFKGGWKRIWGRDIEARHRVLSQLLASAGISNSSDCISAAISSSFIDDIARADKDMIERLITELAK